MQFPTNTFQEVKPQEFFFAALNDGELPKLYRRLGEGAYCECLDTYIGSRHGEHQFSEEESRSAVQFEDSRMVQRFDYKVNIGA